MLRLTEVYRYRQPDQGYLSILSPGPISEDCARKIFANNFDRAVSLGVLVFYELLDLSEEELCLKYSL